MSEEQLGECWCGEPAIFQDQVTLRDYCLECSLDPKRSSMNTYLQFIDSTLPFIVGDRVDCYQAGDRNRFVGTGEITEISTELEEGGTPVFPAYRVEFEAEEDRWFTAICLQRNHQAAEAR